MSKTNMNKKERILGSHAQTLDPVWCDEARDLGVTQYWLDERKKYCKPDMKQHERSWVFGEYCGALGTTGPNGCPIYKFLRMNKSGRKKGMTDADYGTVRKKKKKYKSNKQVK